MSSVGARCSHSARPAAPVRTPGLHVHLYMNVHAFDGHEGGRAQGGARGARRGQDGQQGVAAASASCSDSAGAPRVDGRRGVEGRVGLGPGGLLLTLLTF